MPTFKSKFCISKNLCSRKKNCVYSIQKNKYSKDIVDAVLKIMDDAGPRPMRNLRPVQKIPNGAEKFDKDHQTEYEVRGKQSRGKLNQVQNHNRAYPKMYDELDKRQSTANVTAIDSVRNNSTVDRLEYDPKCRACVKLKRLGTKSSIIKQRQNKSYRRKPRRQDNRSRIVKQKRQTPKRCKPCSSRGIYKLTSIGCQCINDLNCCIKINRTTSVVFSNLEPICHLIDTGKLDTDPNTSKCLDGRGQDPLGPETLTSSKKEDSETNSDVASRKPESSQHSMSSYNSYVSMDHEPMVLP